MAADKHDAHHDDGHHDEGPHIETTIVPQRSPEDKLLVLATVLAFFMLCSLSGFWYSQPVAQAPAHGEHAAPAGHDAAHNHDADADTHEKSQDH